MRACLRQVRVREKRDADTRWEEGDTKGGKRSERDEADAGKVRVWWGGYVAQGVFVRGRRYTLAPGDVTRQRLGEMHF